MDNQEEKVTRNNSISIYIFKLNKTEMKKREKK